MPERIATAREVYCEMTRGLQRDLRAWTLVSRWAILFALVSCGGQTQSSPDAGGGDDVAAGSSCASAQCSSQVGTLPAPLCGEPPNAGAGYIIWFEPSGNCVCQDNDAGVLTACSFVTPAQCAASTDCESCNTTQGCAWCNTTGSCDFRPALECAAGLAKPDCSP